MFDEPSETLFTRCVIRTILRIMTCCSLVGWTDLQTRTQDRPSVVTRTDQENLRSVAERLSMLGPIDSVYNLCSLGTSGLITEVVWLYCFDQKNGCLQETIDWIVEIREKWESSNPAVRKYFLDQWNKTRQRCNERK